MGDNNLPTLKEAFAATFHNKHSFEEFINLDLPSEVSLRRFRNREIYAPSKKLSSFQRFIANTILGHGRINYETAFSYIKGSKASDSLIKHRKSKYFYKTDITNFFHGFNEADIRTSFESNLENFPISDIEKYKDKIVSLTCYDNKLPIGFITSPAFSNIILYETDNLLEQYCTSNSIAYSRYSDDIIFSGDEAPLLKSAIDYLRLVLKDKFDDRLSINEKKTKILHRGQKIKLLGSVILPNGTITIDKSLKNEIELFLHFYLNDKRALADYFNKDLDAATSEIEGKINYAYNIDESYIDKLRMKYGNALIDMLIHRSI